MFQCAGSGRWVGLDVGCGLRPRQGYLGVDLLRTSSANVLANAESGLPFRENVFPAAYLGHVLEHFDRPVAVLDEVWRVCSPGAIVEIRGPHFSSLHLVWGDPTHRRGLSSGMFSYFTPESNWHGARARFQVESVELSISGIDPPPTRTGWLWGLRAATARMLEALVNRSLVWVQRAERYLASFVSFAEIRVVLRVVKR